MKALLTILFACLILFCAAQKNTTKPASWTEMLDFYRTHELCPDSSDSPFLYSMIYNWMGTRYKYAGKGKKGIDCSGFVREIYQEAFCITLSGGSRDIWPMTVPVEKEELCEGDLVFFRIRRGQISHVGLYLGNNKFAHASVKKGVIISDLREAYYQKYFYKGGRVSAVKP
jgi:lipoprotein Spr